MHFNATIITWNKQSTMTKTLLLLFLPFLLLLPTCHRSPSNSPCISRRASTTPCCWYSKQWQTLPAIKICTPLFLVITGIFLSHSCPLYQAPLCRLLPLSEEYPPPILKPSSSSLSSFVSFNSGVSIWVYQLLSSFTARVLVIIFVVCHSCFWRNMLEGLAEMEGLEYGGWWGRFIDRKAVLTFTPLPDTSMPGDAYEQAHHVRTGVGESWWWKRPWTPPAMAKSSPFFWPNLWKSVVTGSFCANRAHPSSSLMLWLGSKLLDQALERHGRRKRPWLMIKITLDASGLCDIPA